MPDESNNKKPTEMRIITTRKLRRDAAEVELLVSRPWYRTPEVHVPRQYARLCPEAIEKAREFGLAELVKLSKLPRATILEILAP